MGVKGKPCFESGGPGILDQMLVLIIYSVPEIEDKLLVQQRAFSRNGGGFPSFNEVKSSSSHEEHFHDTTEIDPIGGRELGDP